MSLTFNAKTHRYRMDKQHVSGVTTVLGKAIPKDALKFWAARTVAEYVHEHEDDVAALRAMGGRKLVEVLKQVPFDKRDDAAQRGTDIHEIAEDLVWGREVDVPEGLVDIAADFARFLDDWSVEPILTEKSVGNRSLWYAGRFDFIGRVGGVFGGQVTCLDWKSSKGVYAETALQTAAYARAEFYVTDDDPEEELPLPEVERLGVVHLTPDGVRVYDLGDPDEHFKLFRHIAYAAQRLPKMDDLVKVPAPNPTEDAQ